MKLYYSISEVAKLLDVTTSTLRHWEKEFSHISPKRLNSFERQYTQKDIDDLRTIKFLIHERKMTTQGARDIIQSQRKGKSSATGRRADLLLRLTNLRKELIELRNHLN